MKFLTRTIWILSVISLLKDTASETFYPVMPLYIKSIGFPIVLIWSTGRDSGSRSGFE